MKKLLDTAYEIQAFEIKAFSQNLIDVKATIEECITIEAKEALRKKIKITLVTTDDLPKFITDEMCFKQIIVNFISRAIEYSPNDRSILIQLSQEKEEEKDSLVITIDDNGFGFTEEYTQRISIQFGSNRHEDGTNISLFSIRQLVSLLGGSCELYSTFGQGTSVRLLFPLFNNQKNGPNEENAKNNVVKLIKS